ncbi:histidine phosphatase family protein [Acinetobacter haemolyticus]|jgi:alpha-ribazole phosphatase|uniref:histidine phosphatase family protein n=1 Tax=unclassified Acinetobacter TaxID=196816 RepID=UPI0015D3B229|nr:MULTISPECIES: histidine phosphatase family protein [unclassified Acinetobacter]UDM37090.1 histidine phosphatase family protein [Acinetobacter haemolyticus]
MYRIDLLRHGETELSHTLRGSTDDALTDSGWQQMQQTVDQFLKNNSPNPWDIVFSSPLQRCALFADEIASNLKLELILDRNLQEMHFGDWEAVSTQEIYEKQPDVLAQFWETPTRFSPPNAETMQQFQQRILHALQQIQGSMQHNQFAHAMVVTHGGVIKLLKCLAFNQPLDNILKMSAELGQFNHFILHDDLSIEYVEQSA